MPPAKKFPRDSETFIGMFRPEHTEAEISRIGHMDDCFFTSEFECQLNRSYGTWDHSIKCPKTEEIGWTCPYEDHTRARRYLSRLQTRPFLRILFCNPSLAAEHECMDEQELLVRPR